MTGLWHPAYATDSISTRTTDSSPPSAVVSGSSGASSSLAFNPAFLRLSDGDKANNIDLSYFSSKGGQMPGDYEVDVILNGQRVDTATLHFISQHDHPGQLFACLKQEDLDRW
ncbi:FimD/PapC N-terminal domain-containing protein, partial [Salmonella enterica]